MADLSNCVCGKDCRRKIGNDRSMSKLMLARYVYMVIPKVDSVIRLLLIDAQYTA